MHTIKDVDALEAAAVVRRKVNALTQGNLRITLQVREVFKGGVGYGMGPLQSGRVVRSARLEKQRRGKRKRQRVG